MGGSVVIQYAIKVVPPEWDSNMPIPFTKETHDRWREELQNGTRVLIFKSAPVNLLVGEGEVHGFFIQPKEWASAAIDGLPPNIRGADYLLPLGMVYLRGSEYSRLYLEDVRAALEDPNFPASPDELRPLEPAIYQRLIRQIP